MWFIFPQLAALGRSPTARHYGLQDLHAARAYLADPVLGTRLRECVAIIFGRREPLGPRHLRLPRRPEIPLYLTLFEAAAPAELKPLFAAALDSARGGIAWVPEVPPTAGPGMTGLWLGAV